MDNGFSKSGYWDIRPPLPGPSHSRRKMPAGCLHLLQSRVQWEWYKQEQVFARTGSQKAGAIFPVRIKDGRFMQIPAPKPTPGQSSDSDSGCDPSCQLNCSIHYKMPIEIACSVQIEEKTLMREPSTTGCDPFLGSSPCLYFCCHMLIKGTRKRTSDCLSVRLPPRPNPNRDPIACRL